MDVKSKQKLVRTSTFDAIEKIMENSQKVAGKLFAGISRISTNLRTEKPANAGGYSLFQHVKVNYPYLNRIQPELYLKPRQIL